MLHAQAFYALFRKTPNEKGSNYAKRLSEELPKGSMQGSCSRKISQELEHTLGLSGTQLRELVNRLRKERIPIASDSYGYFYASTAGEVYETIRFLQRIDAGL